jgi:hypothetical protein
MVQTDYSWRGREKNRGGEVCEVLFMRNTDGLDGLARKIAVRLATKPEVFIIHPAELRILRSMSDQDLRAFAAERGWRVVQRVGGRQIEFYNDAGVRQRA